MQAETRTAVSETYHAAAIVISGEPWVICGKCGHKLGHILALVGADGSLPCPTPPMEYKCGSCKATSVWGNPEREG